MTHAELLAFVSLASVAMFAGSIVMIPWFVARIPADYFSSEHHAQPILIHHHGSSVLLRILKNVIGVALLAAGIAMLVLPGQGVLTILVSLVLLDFPGKRRLERWAVAKPHVRSTLNRLRRRRGKPPLVMD